MEHEAVLTDVREAHVFDEKALALYLGEILDGDFIHMTVRQFEGGQSNPTFLLTVGSSRYVMRKKPPGKLLRGAHMIEREFEVMNALQGSEVPVPEMLHLCMDESIIGTPFYVMSYIEGRVIADPNLPGLSRLEREALFADAMRVAGALHRLDPESVGLGCFGKKGNYYQRQVHIWSKQYEASKTESIEAMDALMDWLPQHTPQAGRTALVHGDFRFGNFVLHPTEPRIVAVLDWELSTLGEPQADLAYFAMGYHYMPYGGSLLEEGHGIPAEATLQEMYETRSGETVTDWRFKMAFQLFRLAAIVQGVVRRGMDGNASSGRWQALRREAVGLATAGWRFVR